MTRGAGGALALAVAALLVCCSADPHQEQDGRSNQHSIMDQYNSNGHKTRNLDPLGGGHLTREVRAARHYADPLPYLAARRMYGKQEPWPGAALTNNFGFTKRNFDEIDRSDLNTFMGKRNFDEIDQTSMPFPYATKRFYHLYGNYLDYPVEHLRSGFDKKRLRAEYPMDEIDLSHFPIGSKRSQDDPADLAAKEKQSNDGLPPRKLRFDEIDNSYFPIG